MQVKICGITNEADALFAAQCGAAAIGFIFYAASPRYIEPGATQKIIRKLPQSLVSVGVFVNESQDIVKRIIESCGLDMIQLRGDEPPEYCRNFPAYQVIKAVELKNETDLRLAESYNTAAILVDSRYAGLYGGTGRRANWELALRLKLKKPLILSGGLNDENITEAIEKVRPPALDINSGVEISPGKKDHAKIASLFKTIRKVDLASDNAKLIFTKRGI